MVMQNAIKGLRSEKIKTCNFIIIRSSGQTHDFVRTVSSWTGIRLVSLSYLQVPVQEDVWCPVLHRAPELMTRVRTLPSLSTLRGCEVAARLFWASVAAPAQLTWEMQPGTVQMGQDFPDLRDPASTCSASPQLEIRFGTIHRWSRSLKILRKLDGSSRQITYKIQFIVRNSEKLLQFSENKFALLRTSLSISNCVQSLQKAVFSSVTELSINYDS